MAIKLADAFVAITGDNNPLRRVLNSTQNLLQGFLRNVVQGIGQGIGQALFNTISGGIRRGMALIGASLSATRDLNESLSKTVVAFGDSAQGILEWSKTSATALGQSRQQALEAASGFGLLFSAIGVTEDASADMSKTLVELATDIASINNVSIDEALIALRAGLVGETEPLRRFNILLSAARVEADVLTRGLASNAEQITEQQKVQSRYNLILQDTIKTQGDFQRTLSGIANQERVLQAQREVALAQIGSAFAPIYLVVLRNINRLIQEINPYGEGIVRSLAEGMVNGIIYLLPVVRMVRDFFTEWFRPQSPPKVLPDLARWGKETFQVYLDSMADADFGVLRDLGGTIEGILRSFVTSGDIAENDIVSRVFGTRSAIAQAISQWSRAGQVTEQSIQAIQNAAGPAGRDLAGLVRAFFDLEGASRRAAQAQDELRRVTEHYDRALSPLQDRLDDINAKQQAINDQRSISELRRANRDPATTATQRRLNLLEIEEIQLRGQMDAVERERDTALSAAEAKLQAAQREEQVARAIYDAQQALLDNQVKLNSLIGEENDLRKRQAEDAERLYQATLRYNLAIADTEGKIALMRLELTRHKEGSVEYFDVLTQIAGLEEQLENERASKGPLVEKDDILPDTSELGVPQWAQDLADRLDAAWQEIIGSSGPPIDPNDLIRQGVPTEVALKISEDTAPSEVSQNIKDFVASIKALTEALQGVTPPLEKIGEAFGGVSDDAEQAGEETEKATSHWLEKTTLSIKAWTAIQNKDWSGFWDAYQEYAAIVQEETARANEEHNKGWIERTDETLGSILGAFALWNPQVREAWNQALMNMSITLGQWLTDRDIQFTNWLGGIQTAIAEWDLGEAGRAFISSLWEGMKSFWDENVKPWFSTEALQGIADLLPGSEPKDPTSPLRGLPDRGQAIVDQLQAGIDSASLQLPEIGFGAVPSGAIAGGGASRTLNLYEGAIQINGSDGGEGLRATLVEALQEVLDGWGGDDE